MPNELEIIDQVIAQHKIVRLNLQGVETSLTDFDALFNLQRAQSSWAQSSVENLQSQKKQLEESLDKVQKGLSGHFTWEEEVLPPLFGDVLMKGLLAVHGEIRRQLENTVSLMDIPDIEKMEQKDLVAQRSRLHEATAALGRMVEAHATLEEQILDMMRKGFQG